MSTGIEEMEAELDAGGNRGMQDFRYGLRKFHDHSENIAIPAKFRHAHFFAIIAKIRYHSENYCA